MGKRMLRGWQGPKVGKGVGSGRWGGWTGRSRDAEVWMATGRGRQGGGIWKGSTGIGDGDWSNWDGKRVAVGRGTT